MDQGYIRRGDILANSRTCQVALARIPVMAQEVSKLGKSFTNSILGKPVLVVTDMNYIIFGISCKAAVQAHQR